MARKKIKLNVLSQKSIDDALKFIRDYQKEVDRKTNQFVELLAQRGVGIAQAYVIGYDAIDTATLFNSIHAENVSQRQHIAEWLIKTDCDWACYVEFGMGIIGEGSPHPLAGEKDYKYDVNNHGVDGWIYYKDGAYHWTNGYQARPFMLETAMDLRESDIILECARKVWGGRPC